MCSNGGHTSQQPHQCPGARKHGTPSITGRPLSLSRWVMAEGLNAEVDWYIFTYTLALRMGW